MRHFYQWTFWIIEYILRNVVFIFLINTLKRIFQPKLVIVLKKDLLLRRIVVNLAINLNKIVDTLSLFSTIKFPNFLISVIWIGESVSPWAFSCMCLCVCVSVCMSLCVCMCVNIILSLSFLSHTIWISFGIECLIEKPQTNLMVYSKRKCHRVNDSNNRNLFSQVLEAESSRSGCQQVCLLLKSLFGL